VPILRKEIRNIWRCSIIKFGIEKILSSRVGGALVVNNTELKIDVSYVKKMIIFNIRWLINPLYGEF
jgi:hypothetical protein